jgi:hypothetical protein
MIILYDNKVMTSTNTTTSDNVLYPLSNLKDRRLSRKYRTNGANTVSITIAGSNINAGYLAILNHNLTASASITLYGSDDPAFVAGLYSKQITYRATNIIEKIPPEVPPEYIENFGGMMGDVIHDDFMFGDYSNLGAMTYTYDYWKITITDTSLSYIEMGLVYLGTALAMPQMKQLQDIKTITNAKINFSMSGQGYGTDDYNYRELNCQFPIVTSAEKVSILSMFATIKNNIPFIMMLWENDLAEETEYYAIINQRDLSFKRTPYMFYPYTTDIQFREVF